MDEDLSPAMTRKSVHLATKLPSFESARESVAEALEVELTTKRIERLTKRIGSRRVAEREARIAAWEQRPLMEKLAAPRGVRAPEVVCVSCDGGRLQRCDLPADAKSHWCETKVGIALELQPQIQEIDPCPQVPDAFLNLGRIDRLTREIKRTAPKGSVFQRTEPEAEAMEPSADEASDPLVSPPPVVESREVVASLADSTRFGKHLASMVWGLGYAGARLKAFVADGGIANWGIWERHFKHLEFIPILDFIHALTYVYSAGLAGRSAKEGGAIYVRWIRWVWQGDVARVLPELRARAEELGAPPEDAADTDPRRILAEALTYLTNQQSRMNYPAYRCWGLPITSSVMESTVKQINYRVKGSEKFWSQPGAEALLQLRADQLSDTAPLEHYWTQRPSQATGTRIYRVAA